MEKFIIEVKRVKEKNVCEGCCFEHAPGCPDASCEKERYIYEIEDIEPLNKGNWREKT